MRNVIQWNKAQEAFLQDEANLKRCPITNENEDEVNSPRGKSSPRKQEKKNRLYTKHQERRAARTNECLDFRQGSPQSTSGTTSIFKYQQSECFPKHLVFDNVWKKISYDGILKDPESADVCNKMGYSNGVDEKRPKK